MKKNLLNCWKRVKEEAGEVIIFKNLPKLLMEKGDEKIFLKVNDKTRTPDHTSGYTPGHTPGYTPIAWTTENVFSFKNKNYQKYGNNFHLFLKY